MSETGKFANRFWFEIPIHFPFEQLGEFVVMTNHVHGIIIIDKPTNSGNIDFVEMSGDDDDAMIDAGGDTIVETPNMGVSTVAPNHATVNIENHVAINNPPVKNVKTDAASAKWKPGILGSIINQYKRICTIHARKINPGFSWQSRFHDHIIRNHKSFVRISNYIINNPVNWQDDQFY